MPWEAWILVVMLVLATWANMAEASKKLASADPKSIRQSDKNFIKSQRSIVLTAPLVNGCMILLVLRLAGVF